MHHPGSYPMKPNDHSSASDYGPLWNRIKPEEGRFRWSGCCSTGTKYKPSQTFPKNLIPTPLPQHPFISHAAGYALLVHVLEEGEAVFAACVEHGADVGDGYGAVFVQVGHYPVG